MSLLWLLDGNDHLLWGSAYPVLVATLALPAFASLLPDRGFDRGALFGMGGCLRTFRLVHLLVLLRMGLRLL